MTSYHYIGLILGGIAGCCFAVSILSIVLLKMSEPLPAYCRRMPRKCYTKEFLQAMDTAYEVAGDIRGMLLLLQGKWNKGVPGKRIPAALDYLEHSRYKDYETTLQYLSDHTQDCDSVLQRILEKEIRKQTALTEK